MLAAAVLASSTAVYAGEALKKTAAAESFTEADQEPAAEQEDLSAAQFTTETIQLLNGNRAAVHSCDGRVYFVEGSCSAGPVKNMEDAERVLPGALSRIRPATITMCSARCMRIQQFPAEPSRLLRTPTEKCWG